MHSRRRLPADLGVKAADALGDGNERPQKGHRLRERHRSVEGETGQPTVEHRDHLVADLECDADLCLLG